MQYLAQCRESR